MAPRLGLRLVHNLRVEASKRNAGLRPSREGVEAVELPEELWGNGTVEDLEKWLVKAHGLSGSMQLGVDGFALLPGQLLAALLRENDEVMVSPLRSNICMALPPPDARAESSSVAKTPKAKRPKAIADAPQGSAETAPAPTPQKKQVPAQKAGTPCDGARSTGGGLEAVVKEQARRIQELEEQNELLRRKLEATEAQPAAPSGVSWAPVAVEELKKGNVIRYQLDLIDAWQGTMQRSETKVAVIKKVSRNVEGVKSFVLRCESGGVDFVEASGLRNVQLAAEPHR